VVSYEFKLSNMYAQKRVISGDQIKEGDMGGDCSTHGSDQK